MNPVIIPLNDDNFGYLIIENDIAIAIDISNQVNPNNVFSI